MMLDGVIGVWKLSACLVPATSNRTAAVELGDTLGRQYAHPSIDRGGRG